MNRILILILVLAAAASCSRADDYMLWDKSLGPGEAFCLTNAGDTGIIYGGTLNGKPYITYLDVERQKKFEYSPGIEGTVTYVTLHEGCIISAGSSGGKMMLMANDLSGNALWDTLLQFDFTIGRTTLCSAGSGSLMAMGSVAGDSIKPVPHGLAFVKFGSEGEIESVRDTISGYYLRGGNICADNAGNYYIALTRLGTGGKIKATVVSYDERFRKLWETELYNNPLFGASSLDITEGASGDLFISGYAELSVNNGTNKNAFAAAVGKTGQVIWKRYLEYTNNAPSLITDDTGMIYVLNSGCIILNSLNPADGTVTGILRTFAACDPAKDKVPGNAVIEGPGGELIVAGSRNGSFYLVAKSPDELSPI